MTAGTITLLDVGHGSCVILSSNGRTAVVDCGSGSTFLEYLRSDNLTRLGQVLISHADRDHVGGLVGVLGSGVLDVEEVWLNGDAFKGSRLWHDLVYELDAHERGSQMQLEFGVREGRTFGAGDFTVQILAPRARLVGLGPGGRDSNGRRIESNTLSVVAKVTISDEPVALLPGDLDELGLEHLLDTQPTPDLRAPILVFPHHGGHVSRSANEGTNARFASKLVQLVMPNVVIFSIGRGMHDTPRREVMAAVKSEAPNVNVVCTQLSETCAVALPGKDVGRPHLNNTVARGRSAGSCCGGSIIISVEESGWTINPTLAHHREFVDAYAGTRLCR